MYMKGSGKIIVIEKKRTVRNLIEFEGEGRARYRNEDKEQKLKEKVPMKKRRTTEY